MVFEDGTEVSVPFFSIWPKRYEQQRIAIEGSMIPVQLKKLDHKDLNRDHEIL